MNIICLKVGKKYSCEYVNNLHYMVFKNTTKNINFYCFTDNKKNINKNIKCIDLPNLDHKKIHGWFYKLALFDPIINPIRGTILYLDLDIVIINNIDCFFEFDDSKLNIIEDWIYKKNNIRKYNSSVMMWNTKNYNNLFNDFTNNIFKKVYFGDQDFITDYIKDVNFWPENWCISYKWSKCFENPSLINYSKIIVFHGKPKPHEITEDLFIKNNTIF